MLVAVPRGMNTIKLPHVCSDDFFVIYFKGELSQLLTHNITSYNFCHANIYTCFYIYYYERGTVCLVTEQTISFIQGKVVIDNFDLHKIVI